MQKEKLVIKTKEKAHNFYYCIYEYVIQIFQPTRNIEFVYVHPIGMHAHALNTCDPQARIAIIM